MLSGHQALDTLLSLALFQEYDGGKYSPRLEGDDRLWNTNAAPVECLFQNTVMFVLRLILIYDAPNFRKDFWDCY